MTAATYSGTCASTGHGTVQRGQTNTRRTRGQEVAGGGGGGGAVGVCG